MIKIQIDNIVQRKQDYTDAITALVASRVLILQQSLSHLNGAVIDFTTGDFASFKAITRKIVKIVGDESPINDAQTGYTTSINNYLATANSLGNINIAGLLDLCHDLLTNNNQQISDLLVCAADNLVPFSTGILNHHLINTPADRKVVKLAFDYQTYAEIATPIKDFFRANNFSSFCSYCNINRVIHQTTNANAVVESFELDHFYDKSRYPLLSYSLFNLVPSDHTCNVTNKGSIEFSDEYHMNPHHRGYNDEISFVPIGLSTAYEVTSIGVVISEPSGTPIHKKINGNNLVNDDIGEQGNLNVFKIRSKFLDKTHRASKMLTTLHKENKHSKHIKKFIKALTGLDIKANYKNWYESEWDVPFNAANFNDKAFSKFHRDIHDYYFEKNKNKLNSYIIELINTD
jgi:hypothetical protein